MLHYNALCFQACTCCECGGGTAGLRIGWNISVSAHVCARGCSLNRYLNWNVERIIVSQYKYYIYIYFFFFFNSRKSKVQINWAHKANPSRLLSPVSACKRYLGIWIAHRHECVYNLFFSVFGSQLRKKNWLTLQRLVCEAPALCDHSHKEQFTKLVDWMEQHDGLKSERGELRTKIIMLEGRGLHPSANTHISSSTAHNIALAH